MTTQTTPIGRQVESGQVRPGNDSGNVGDTERYLSMGAGALLALGGLSRGTLGGLGLALLGGGLLYRGMSGHCHLYQAMGIDTSGKSPVTSVEAGSGVKVERSITVNRSPSELYAFWRRLENLPQVMTHLVEVRDLGDRSHWVAKGPMGYQVEWDAEIINDRPGELIAWRSLEGASVANAGSVHFHRAPGDRETEIKVVLKYDPPMGKLGASLARLFRQDPGAQIDKDLAEFKKRMESGAGQSAPAHQFAPARM